MCVAVASQPLPARAGFWNDALLRPAQVRPETLYVDAPEISKCREGALQAAEHERVLQAVNAVRALHDLPPVRSNKRMVALAAKASLVMAATGVMSHFPAKNAACANADGRSGSAESNLYLGTFPTGLVPSSEQMVASWVKDLNVQGLGHRRWILDPYLGAIAFGRVDNPAKQLSAGALRVHDPAEPPPVPASGTFVAWPVGRYPAALWDRAAEWSVSLVESSADRFASQFAYFAKSTVEVRDEETQRPVDVSRLYRDDQGFGVPNLLSFRVSGAQPGRWYKVTVRNVTNKGGGTRDLTWRVFIDDAAPKRALEKNGLRWEQKTAANANDTFSLPDAKRYCASIRGRLPTIAELKGLVVPGRKFAVDPGEFANLSEYLNYWSSTPWKGGPQYVDVVAFWDSGKVYQQPPAGEGGALCVLETPK